MKKWFKLNEPVYERDIYFFYCDEKYAISQVKKICGVTDYENGGYGWHMYIYNQNINKNQSFIWIKPDRTLKFYDTLLHEITHCINRMYDACGVTYKSDNDEHYCWHKGALFMQCINFVQKNKLRVCK